MSKHDKIAKLKEYIKNIVIKELEKDEELEEVSTTATAGIDGTGTGHYDTPHAFSSGSAVGHKSPEVGGYKKVNEAITGSNRKELLKIGKEIKDNLFKINPGLKKASDDRLLIRGIANTFMFMRYTPDNANYQNYKKYFPKNFKSSSVQKLANILQNEKDTVRKTFFKQIVKESINEGYGEMMDELEKIYRPSGAPPIAKEALKDLADEYDIGRVLYAARTNRKSFMEVMDMKIDQLQAQHVNKKHINTIKRGKNLKEGKKRFKVGHNIGKAKYVISFHDGKSKHKDGSDFFGIETFRNQKEFEKGKNDLRKKGYIEESIGESINEGRYHDWRNDESLTPKQKIGQSVKEIRDSLNELDKRIKMNLKLKTELNVDSRSYWKNTHKALTKISERLVKMANKVGNLK